MIVTLDEQLLYTFRISAYSLGLNSWLYITLMLKKSMFTGSEILRSPNPNWGLRLFYIQLFQPTNHPPSRISLNLTSGKVAAKSKHVYLVHLDL